MSLSAEVLSSYKEIDEAAVDGLLNKEIAAKLNLSDGTVRNCISTVLSKLNLRDRTQLAIWAVQTGAIHKALREEN